MNYWALATTIAVIWWTVVVYWAGTKAKQSAWEPTILATVVTIFLVGIAFGWRLREVTP